MKVVETRAQSRQAIQILNEARDSVQTLHVGPTSIITGSVDGHIRTYDLRKGELRSDYIGREWRSDVSEFSICLISIRANNVNRPLD